ncbi:MAG: tetratricopeptide repeat protein [Planctomycetaceae bacterium]|nr:tetratricopeptide repeat protein [Planctomycetaceae bacterium]
MKLKTGPACLLAAPLAAALLAASGCRTLTFDPSDVALKDRSSASSSLKDRAERDAESTDRQDRGAIRQAAAFDDRAPSSGAIQQMAAFAAAGPSSGPAGSVASQLNQAHAAESAGRPEQAQKLYRQVLLEDPAHPVAHHRLGVIADQQEDYRTAEFHYQAALQASPYDADLLSDLGYSYLLQERPADSERTLRDALSIDPRHKRALNNLGLLYAKQGDESAALAVFRQAGSEAEAQGRLQQVRQQNSSSGATAPASHSFAGQPGGRPPASATERTDPRLANAPNDATRNLLSMMQQGRQSETQPPASSPRQQPEHGLGNATPWQGRQTAAAERQTAHTPAHRSAQLQPRTPAVDRYVPDHQLADALHRIDSEQRPATNSRRSQHTGPRASGSPAGPYSSGASLLGATAGNSLGEPVSHLSPADAAASESMPVRFPANGNSQPEYGNSYSGHQVTATRPASHGDYPQSSRSTGGFTRHAPEPRPEGQYRDAAPADQYSGELAPDAVWPPQSSSFNSARYSDSSADSNSPVQPAAWQQGAGDPRHFAAQHSPNQQADSTIRQQNAGSYPAGNYQAGNHQAGNGPNGSMNQPGQPPSRPSQNAGGELSRAAALAGMNAGPGVVLPTVSATPRRQPGESLRQLPGSRSQMGGEHYQQPPRYIGSDEYGETPRSIHPQRGMGVDYNQSFSGQPMASEMNSAMAEAPYGAPQGNAAGGLPPARYQSARSEQYGQAEQYDRGAYPAESRSPGPQYSARYGSQQHADSQTAMQAANDEYQQMRDSHAGRYNAELQQLREGRFLQERPGMNAVNPQYDDGPVISPGRPASTINGYPQSASQYDGGPQYDSGSPRAYSR